MLDLKWMSKIGYVAGGACLFLGGIGIGHFTLAEGVVTGGAFILLSGLASTGVSIAESVWNPTNKPV